MGTVTGHTVGLNAIEEIKQQLKLTDSEVAAIVGVNTSTLWRWREERVTPRGITRSRLAQLEELRNLLRQVFDGPDLAREWLRSSHPDMLGGRVTPMEVMLEGRIDRVLTVLQFLARGA
jgi:transcriptional regulator with XRE-family HTH domain